MDKTRLLIISPLVILLLLTAAMITILTRGIFTSQSPGPSKAVNNLVRVDDADSTIIYHGPWGTQSSGGFNYHYAPAPLDGTTITENLGATASFIFVGTKITIGSVSWINRGYMDISIDTTPLPSFNTFAGQVGPITWTSNDLPCAPHTIKISQSDKAGANGGRGITLDYFEYQTCQPPVPGLVLPPTSCQGNTAAPAKCFDCKKDNADSSQINVFDFSCFSKLYGKKIGVNQTSFPTSCNTSADCPPEWPICSPSGFCSRNQVDPNPPCPCTQSQLNAGYQCVLGCGSPVTLVNETRSYVCLPPGTDLKCPICLSQNTKINTPHGQINVQDLKVGDLVFTVDNQGKTVAGPIKKISQTPVPPTHQVLHLVLSDGRQLNVSPHHPDIFDRDLALLKPGDVYDSAKIISNNLFPYPYSATYDLLPDSASGIYFANSIPVKSTLK